MFPTLKDGILLTIIGKNKNLPFISKKYLLYFGFLGDTNRINPGLLKLHVYTRYLLSSFYLFFISRVLPFQPTSYLSFSFPVIPRHQHGPLIVRPHACGKNTSLSFSYQTPTDTRIFQTHSHLFHTRNKRFVFVKHADLKI